MSHKKLLKADKNIRESIDTEILKIELEIEDLTHSLKVLQRIKEHADKEMSDEQMRKFIEVTNRFNREYRENFSSSRYLDMCIQDGDSEH